MSAIPISTETVKAAPRRSPDKLTTIAELSAMVREQAEKMHERTWNHESYDRHDLHHLDDCIVNLCEVMERLSNL